MNRGSAENVCPVSPYIYWPERSWAKVIFSQACVKNSVPGGGVSASVHAGMHPPLADPPQGSRLQHMVNEQPVHILLECILVLYAV